MTITYNILCSTVLLYSIIIYLVDAQEKVLKEEEEEVEATNHNQPVRETPSQRPANNNNNPDQRISELSRAEEMEHSSDGSRPDISEAPRMKKTASSSSDSSSSSGAKLSSSSSFDN